MLNPSFIIDDDFTLNVLEEPDEHDKVKSEENDTAEEVKPCLNTDFITNGIKEQSENLSVETLLEEEKDNFAVEVKKEVENMPLSSPQETSNDNNPVNEKECNKDLDPQPTPNRKQSYQCPKCMYKTDRYMLYLTHIDAHLENQKHLKCTSCDYVTFNKGQMSVHKAHCGNYAHKIYCAQCEYVTTKNKLLRKHINTRHLGQMVHRCCKCPFRTGVKAEMIKHREDAHPKPTFKCELCSFEAPAKWFLQKHEKKHLPRRIVPPRVAKHKCDLCEFAHSNKKVIVKHMKIHHKVDFKKVKEDNKEKIGMTA